MDDVARVTSREDSDLASIVLGTTSAGTRRRLDAPERVPAWIDDMPTRGYDARSVAVLALVVAVLAATVGWATTFGDASTPEVAAPSPTAPAASPDDAFGDAFGSAKSVVERGASKATSTSTSAAPAVAGANLAAGRLVASQSGSGTGLVTLAVRNTGDETTAADGTDVLVIANGDVLGTGRLVAIAPGASARVEVPLDWCPSGSVSVVAVVDPSSAVREANEFDNSVSRSVSFGC
ncbi:MAG: hypothetical protein JWL76_1336 [Thermoleophilia bacterium]|nr:hypothetical protein [Thermoleophilia bacterium]